MTLDPRLPAILLGTEKPAKAAEQLTLAQMCLFKKTYAAAARFFRDPFTAERKLADVVPAGSRHNVARAATLAGCGGFCPVERNRPKLPSTLVVTTVSPSRSAAVERNLRQPGSRHDVEQK